MRFWLREIAGWLLVALGLYLFLEVYNLLQDKAYFQSGPIVLMGIFVFRGGIQLLKIAVAARIASQAQEQARVPTTPRVVERRRTAPGAVAGRR